MSDAAPLRFGVIGIDHPHVLEQVARLLELGFECGGWYTDGEPRPLEARYVTCADASLPYYPNLVRDVRERTETAMAQSHCFRVMELALTAQAQATRLQ